MDTTENTKQSSNLEVTLTLTINEIDDLATVILQYALEVEHMSDSHAALRDKLFAISAAKEAELRAEADKYCQECMTEKIECGAPHDWTVAEVTKIPNCDWCKTETPAEYDAATDKRIWGYMCQAHFIENGASLGLGKGQKLVKVGA